MDFGAFATPACNQVRRKNSPPSPDADGLFDATGVDIICGRRQCHFEPVIDLLGRVQFMETRVQLVTIAPGRWDPAAILAACTRAHGNRVYEVDTSRVTPANPSGLDELKIARIVGADGVRPYLSKKSRYFEGRLGVVTPAARPVQAERRYNILRRSEAGKPTWAFRSLLFDVRGPRTSDYKVRRALRALEDAGLMHIQLGKMGGMATAKCTWTTRAYLTAPEFSLYDEDALAQIAAGLA
ncbi:hypothetical protein [Bradyrhizobium australafricanum]|uniref:hypothetical protein n=1 Tax=Bradyrhizobium australafricanum TaxID=2821406 RepID=UPI001CE27559|nr:hypothetical protein [Bradyrhizobium australafricanum]MCA6098153.1 hypothetical protein [Bradyrhizobium australafricanum]